MTMKNRTLYYTLLIGLMAIILYTSFTSADIQLWKENIINNQTNIVIAHGYFQFQDDSTNLLGKQQTVPMAIQYFYQSLPYNISATYPQYANAYVDWCNVTMTHNEYNYDSLGNVASQNQTVYNQYLDNNVADDNTTYFNLKHQDSVIVDIDCHYTNSQTLFIDNVLFADFGNWFPAYACSGCEGVKFEDLANEISFNQQQADKEILIYSKIQSLVDINLLIWNYGSYIVKILLVIGAIGLIFALAYFFYIIFDTLAKRIT